MGTSTTAHNLFCMENNKERPGYDAVCGLAQF